MLTGLPKMILFLSITQSIIYSTEIIKSLTICSKPTLDSFLILICPKYDYSYSNTILYQSVFILNIEQVLYKSQLRNLIFC